jgi:hypothetical protein
MKQPSEMPGRQLSRPPEPLFDNRTRIKVPKTDEGSPRPKNPQKNKSKNPKRKENRTRFLPGLTAAITPWGTQSPGDFLPLKKNLLPSTTGKSLWSTPLMPTSASAGMMEKNGMCGSPQQPFTHACDLTAHETFMPVPTTHSLFASNTPPNSCA